MASTTARVGLTALALALASTLPALADPPDAPAPAAAAATSPAPTATPNPFSTSGRFRSYYFTRQNASNNPGAQFNFTPGAKYSTTGVNQATWSNAIDLHADYHFAGGGWYVGGSYLFSDPFNGPCVTAPTHIKGQPCVSQSPPNTNPDDSVPGFVLNTFYEAYIGYTAGGFSAKLGDQLFDSPWANPEDSRLKPEAFQGGDFKYETPQGFTYELADMLQFEPRTSSTFQSNTLLTSYPAGNSGLPANIYVPGGGGITTAGFIYGKVGYAPKGGPLAADGYFYGVSDIVNMYWGDAKYTFGKSSLKPYVAVQGGWESNSGASYIGKIQSSVIGAQLGVTPWSGKAGSVTIAGSFDETPWHYDTVALPAHVACGANYQISAKGATLPYFLPTNAAACVANPDGTTTIAYGGWASPYTDNYTSNPVFTTAISQSAADRRAPMSAWGVSATFQSRNKRETFIVAQVWSDYSNNIASQHTNEFDLDNTYRFMPMPKSGPYKGLAFRYRYAARTFSNTFCGASDTACPAGLSYGAAFLGGSPLFKYNRAMLEYDF
ncbi:MAG TPA: hypothetical protein VIJ77_12245 [Candidatus Tumulicola sp.]